MPSDPVTLALGIGLAALVLGAYVLHLDRRVRATAQALQDASETLKEPEQR